jgi:predicted XRE-type DNA-binding protein
MDNKLDKLLESVDQIKRLLILALLRSGASQGEVAKGLGVNQSSISRLFAEGSDKKTKKNK